MEPKILKTDAEYKTALAQLQKLMHSKPGTQKADRLELWARLVEDYENARYPVESPDPVAAILFRMEQENLKPKDLEPYLGSKSKISEVLSRKRTLTLSMIRKLHSGLGIPAEALLAE
jgi:HTH-type transcriptional regulator/antitoxin HigA